MEESLKKFSDSFAKIAAIKKETAKVIIGQEEAINHILVCLFSGSHLLLESVPGLAKSLMVETLSKILRVPYKRIQLTPDMMPQDVTGFEMPVFGTTDFNIRKGPIFCGLCLADELNRTTPKTQSAFMQCMQEKMVTIGLETFKLDEIFTMLATRNPIETEGTFSLAEAILDRFLLNTILGYPPSSEEKNIVFTIEDLSKINFDKVCGPEEILPIRHYLVSGDFVKPEHPIVDYAIRLMRASRPEQSHLYLGQNDDKWYKSKVRVSLASPRTTKAFVRAAWVYSRGIFEEEMLLPEHVKTLAKSVLRHRLILQSEAEFDGLNPDKIIEWLLDRIPIYV